LEELPSCPQKWRPNSQFRRTSCTMAAVSSSAGSSSSPHPGRVQPPRWLSVRLLLGVLLVLASVLIGARVVASADSTTRMWAASRQLGPGVVLAASDLKPVRVRLPDGDGSYVRVVESVVGKTINAQVGAGALLPRAALGVTEPATTVT